MIGDSDLDRLRKAVRQGVMLGTYGKLQGLRRVEMWRGCLGLHSGCWLFRLPVPQYQTMLRFHIPLIELDVPN